MYGQGSDEEQAAWDRSTLGVMTAQLKRCAEMLDVARLRIADLEEVLAECSPFHDRSGRCEFCDGFYKHTEGCKYVAVMGTIERPDSK